MEAPQNIIKKILLILIAGVICGVLLVVLLNGNPRSLTVDIRSPENVPMGAWYTIVHVGHNAVVAWRDDPFVTSALLGVLEVLGIKQAMMAPLVILFLGFATLFYALNKRDSVLRAISAGLLAVFLIVDLFGFDTVIIRSLTFFPWLILAIWWLLVSASPRSILLALISAVELACSAHALAMPLACVAILVCLALVPKAEIQGQVKHVWVIALVPALLALGLARSPDFPNYPDHSHVVMDDGISGIERSMIGVSAAVAVVDRHFVRDTYAHFIQITLIVWGLLVLLVGREHRKIIWLAGGCIAMVAWDLLLPEKLAQIGPLASIARLIPGLFLFPLSVLFSALSLILLVLIIACGSLKRVQGAILLVSLGLILCYPTWQSLAVPWLMQPRKRQALFQFKAMPPAQRQALEPYLVSPSYNLINDLGFWVLEDRARLAGKHFSRGHNLTLSVSHGAETLELLQDGEIATRWSAGRGRQDGSEWLLIMFPELRIIDGVELATGTYKTDFPRGLKISVLDRCYEPERDRRLFQQIFRQANWEGPLMYNADGFPYYGAQYDVRVFFSKSAPVRCMLIEQIGHEAKFDWSLAELRFLTR